MTQEELNEILEKHKKWLNDEDGGECANLSGAYLRNADLSGADLSGANLSGADLSGANLSGAYLRNADLSGANLSGAYLSSADLCSANLSGANLSGADLCSANLSWACLRGTNLDESEKIRQGICLEESMTGYKKCKDGIIVTLEIPAHAVVFSINNGKCRTNTAKVIDIEVADEAVSLHDPKFVYRKGETIYPDGFDCRYNQECASGIHFFRTREEAEKY